MVLIAIRKHPKKIQKTLTLLEDFDRSDSSTLFYPQRDIHDQIVFKTKLNEVLKICIKADTCWNVKADVKQQEITLVPASYYFI